LPDDPGHGGEGPGVLTGGPPAPQIGAQGRAVTPHEFHAEDGPDDCPRCSLLRDGGLTLDAAREIEARLHPPVRRALVARSASGRPTASEVGAYLPAAYAVTLETDETVVIEGTDRAGWTMDGYVIPRLASGMIACREITDDTERTTTP
jgi:hypothetical protein